MRVGEVRNPERAKWGKPLEGVRVLAVEQMQALLALHLFGGDLIVSQLHGRRPLCFTPRA